MNQTNRVSEVNRELKAQGITTLTVTPSGGLRRPCMSTARLT